MTLREHQEQDPSTTFGKGFGGWRNNFAFLSIQNIHDTNQARKAKGPHNSQVNLLEKGVLDPKKQFWYSLEEMNKEIANEKKFLYIKNITLRERLINAKPFLTHDGRVANRGDFVLMFLGMQPIREEYLVEPIRQEPLNAEFLKRFATTLQKEFVQVARENFIEDKQLWKELCKTKPLKAVEEKTVAEMAQDVLRGERVPSVNEASFVMKKYKHCPVYAGLCQMCDHPLSPEMNEIHSEFQKRILVTK